MRERRLAADSQSQSGDRGSADRFSVEKSPHSLPQHRFTDYSADIRTKQKQLKVLNPCRLQTDKSPPRACFGTEARLSPFPVKKEHATVCQHQMKSSTLRSSLGAIPRERRDASYEINYSKFTGPGPADYNTIKNHLKDKPLTSSQSHNTGS